MQYSIFVLIIKNKFAFITASLYIKRKVLTVAVSLIGLFGKQIISGPDTCKNAVNQFAVHNNRYVNALTSSLFFGIFRSTLQTVKKGNYIA